MSVQSLDLEDRPDSLERLLSDAEKDQSIPSRSRTQKIYRIFSPLRNHRKLAALCASLNAIVWLLALTLLVISLRGKREQYQQTRVPSTGVCYTPRARREWRDLSTFQQREYLRAVKCLQVIPSSLHKDDRLHDEFTWIHRHNGSFTHNAAPFLPWHRAFIAKYEQALRGTCGYYGALPYWDWYRDLDDFQHSAVFTKELGFGGNGNFSVVKEVPDGYCVTDGPFANLRLRYWDGEVKDHCLSREFDLHALDRLFSEGNDTQSMLANVLEYNSYEEFVNSLITKSHNVIPNFFGGDFATFGAPNDPLFFLHHANQDRLWWLWQRRKLPERYKDYGGLVRGWTYFDGQKDHFKNKEAGNEKEWVQTATLEDALPLPGHAFADLRVKDVMDTENDLLCYIYI